jgi:hypothetical protein
MAAFQPKDGDSYLDPAKDGDVQRVTIKQGDGDVVFGGTRASEAYSPRAHQAWQEKFGVVPRTERTAWLTNRRHH